MPASWKCSRPSARARASQPRVVLLLLLLLLLLHLLPFADWVQTLMI
jgi:hypothetical protein